MNVAPIIACLQFVLVFSKGQLIRNTEANVQKTRPNLHAVNPVMATQILADGNAIGIRTMAAEKEANATTVLESSTVESAPHLFHSNGSVKHTAFIGDDGVALSTKNAVDNTEILGRETSVDGQKKPHVIRRHEKHRTVKKIAVIKSDAQDVEFMDATPESFTELADSRQDSRGVLLDQPAQAPVSVEAPPVAAPVAAPVTAAPIAQAVPAPAVNNTKAADAQSESGSLVGSIIYNLVIFAILIIALTVIGATGYLCYGALMELKRRHGDRLLAADSEPPASPTHRRRHMQSFSQRIRNSTTFPSRTRAATAEENGGTGSRGLASTGLASTDSRRIYNSRSDDENIPAGTPTGITSLNLPDQPYRNRHKASRASSLQVNQGVSVTSIEPISPALSPRNEGDSGATSYKMRHKASRGSTFAHNKLDAEIAAAHKAGMDDIEEHEF